MFFCCHSTVFDVRYGHNGIGAIQTHAADDGELDVCPVQTFIEVVHRKTCLTPDTLKVKYHHNIMT